MSTAYLNKNFYSKLICEGYPLKGFWYDMTSITLPPLSVGEPISIDQYKDTFVSNINSPGSRIYPCNALIDNNLLKIELNSDNKGGNSNILTWIRLYYLDLVMESGTYQFIDQSGSDFIINRSDEQSREQILNRYAGAINLGENLVDSHPNHIITVRFDRPLTCNFYPITNEITDSSEINSYYDHIQSTDVGQVNTFNTNITNTNLMYKSTSLERLRETQTLLKFSDRNGTMTIKKSGITQL